MTNGGLRIELTTIGPSGQLVGEGNDAIAALRCRFENDASGMLAIRLTKYTENDEYHAICSHDLEPLHSQYGFDKRLSLNSRLAFVKLQDVIGGDRTALKVMRSFEPPFSEAKFLVQSNHVDAKLVQMYLEQLWDVESGIISAPTLLRMRAGVMYECHSGRLLVVTFAFHRRNENGNTVLRPYLRATSRTQWVWLEGYCEDTYNDLVGAISHLNPPTLKSTLRSPENTVELVAEIERTDLAGEPLFVVRITITQFKELDGVDTLRCDPRSVSEKHVQNLVTDEF